MGRANGWQAWVREHCTYYAVPGNSKAVASTHTTVTCAPADRDAAVQAHRIG